MQHPFSEQSYFLGPEPSLRLSEGWARVAYGRSMLILSLFTAWACPPSDGTSPCASLFARLAVPIADSTVEPPETGLPQHALDEPFVYYVDPTVRDSWEASVEVSATLDGASVEPELSFEDAPPFVQLWVDVPVGSEITLSTDYVTTEGTNRSSQFFVGAEPAGATPPEPMFDLDLAEFEWAPPCEVQFWEYRGDATGWILVQPAGVDMSPALHSLVELVPIETSVETSDQCELLREQSRLGEPIDLLVWRVHPSGQVTGPVLLAHPAGALEAAGPRWSTHPPTGCSTAGMTWTGVLCLVPFAMRRRRIS